MRACIYLLIPLVLRFAYDASYTIIPPNIIQLETNYEPDLKKKETNHMHGHGQCREEQENPTKGGSAFWIEKVQSHYGRSVLAVFR